MNGWVCGGRQMLEVKLSVTLGLAVPVSVSNKDRSWDSQTFLATKLKLSLTLSITSCVLKGIEDGWEYIKCNLSRALAPNWTGNIPSKQKITSKHRSSRALEMGSSLRAVSTEHQLQLCV